MKRSTAILFAVIFATIFLDQLSKWYMLEVIDIDARPPMALAPFFSLVMVWNKGVSFGMFNSGNEMIYVLIAVAFIISAILFRLALKTTLRWERIGYALVIGGALGNVIDRFRFGAVADFFYAHIGDLGWPAFNVADSAICVGVGILLLMLFTAPRKA